MFRPGMPTSSFRGPAARIPWRWVACSGSSPSSNGRPPSGPRLTHEHGKRLTWQSGAHVIDVPARDADVELSRTGREQSLALGRLLGEFPEQQRAAAVWS